MLTFPHLFVYPDTTRKPREGEQDGTHYHFTNEVEMSKKVDQGDFIEHAIFSGNHYGTSKQAVEDVTKAGKVCVLDIEMQGIFHF